MEDVLKDKLTDVGAAEQLGLTAEEFDRIVEAMGRVPNFTELSMYSVMWSEHCSYKNSIRLLKTLPRKGSQLLAEAGEENAGLVDLGDGWACAFKIESHNHPSAIEPYQGAATGVGGIHRDIFTMGARPIAALNSLRFGRIQEERTQHLLRGVVKGIGDYGNCFGIPTVAGEVYFDACYQTNPLVNAMSVGVVRKDGVVSAISEGVGNPVFIVGSATGKDGIHGATFASEDISEDSEEKLPSVQVGDPFQEKLLLEASLEVIKTGAVVGMQDMGAAGITCSTSEMSAKGEHGMRINLDRVPTRQEGMRPFEILLSESQERMLVVVEKGKEAAVQAVFDKWDLHCTHIGEVTEGDTLEYFMHGEMVASVSAHSLVLGGGAPVYERPFAEPAYAAGLRDFDQALIPVESDLKGAAKKVIGLPNVASKRWIYEQYDSMVGVANLVTNAPADAALIRVHGTDKVLAITVDCNARYVWADPYRGAMIAVSEAARNIACSGGRPMAITNCLNFGNPYDPGVYWQFTHAIRGMGAACEKFNTPVTGGNVSFYNQSADGGAVFPTPTIGMLGVLEKGSEMSMNFRDTGDIIYEIGTACDTLQSSQYLVHCLGVEKSPCPDIDLDAELRLQQLLLRLIAAGNIRSAHDVSEGGLFTCLLESAQVSGLGFDVSLLEGIRQDAYLFGESQGRVVVSVAPDAEAEAVDAIGGSGIPFRQLGTVTDSALRIDGQDWDRVDEWSTLYDTSLEKQIQKA